MSFEIKDFKYQFHNPEGDYNASFYPAHADESAAGPQYHGMVSENGWYVILRTTISGDISTYEYTFGRSGYTTAWTNRASLDYYRFDQLRDNSF
jgi:hypothetical protein